MGETKKEKPALVIWAFWAESPKRLVAALKSIERLLGMGKIKGKVIKKGEAKGEQ